MLLEAVEAPNASSAASSPTGVELEALLSMDLEERRAHGGRLVALLARAPVASWVPEQLGQGLLTVLEDEQFGLASVSGVVPRHAAVGAVLTLGYPWALQLRAEDVAGVREASLGPTRRRRRRLVVVAFSLLITGGLFSALVITPEVPALSQAVRPMSRPRNALAVGAERPWAAELGELDAIARRNLEAMVEGDQRGGWGRVIEAGERCLQADPINLDCLRRLATGHAAEAARLEVGGPCESAECSFRRLQSATHHRRADELSRRVLSLEAFTDPMARSPGDDPRACLSAPGADDGACLKELARVSSARAAHTQDPIDVAQARRWHSLVLEVLPSTDPRRKGSVEWLRLHEGP
jgi:hypothetical protein